MDKIIFTLREVSPAWYKGLFIVTMAFALFMALIPGSADPTGFINDKVKHAITFMILFGMMDLAFPNSVMPLWKPIGLLAFGVLIEVLQKATGYRDFSFGDIVADCVGISCYYLGRLLALKIVTDNRGILAGE